MSGKMLGSRNTNIQRNLQYHRERDSGSNTSGERSEFSAGLETTLPGACNTIEAPGGPGTTHSWFSNAQVCTVNTIVEGTSVLAVHKTEQQSNYSKIIHTYMHTYTYIDK